MFEYLGRFATKYRYPIILTWIVAAVLITLLAPNIDEVASSDQADFLPSGAPHAHAVEVYEQTFPDSATASNTIIVLDARQGIFDTEAETWPDQIDTPVGRFFVAFENWLNSEEGPDNIERVTTPLVDPTAAALMVAPDNKVAIVRVGLSTTSPEEATTETIHEIEAWLADNVPDGVDAYQTGSGPIIGNTTESISTSVDRTIWVTVALVIVLLLAIYRSPISPLVPLSAVTVAYLITRGIVAYMGDNVMTITSYANVILVVVMYGAGTDYCLFLISRFREEMADHPGIDAATKHTVHRVGETITSSAGTIFVGFMAMVFAEMGIFNTSGPALALGIVLSLAAGLTFVPAILATMGHWAFWPGKATHRAPGTFYEMTSKQVSTYPLATILVIVALMAPLSIYGLSQSVTYNMMADLPDDKPAIVGFELMGQGLGEGNVMPLTVVVTGRDPQQVADDIAILTNDIAALDGVEDVRGLHTPLGQNGDQYNNLLRVDVQLMLALDLMNAMGEGNFDLQGAVAGLRGFETYLRILSQRFPEVADDPSLQRLQKQFRLLLAEIGAADNQGEILAALANFQQSQDEFIANIEGLAATFRAMEAPYLMPWSFDELMQAAAPEQGAMFTSLLNTYLVVECSSSPCTLANVRDPDATVAFKLDVILEGEPQSDAAMDTLVIIRSFLEDYDEPGEAVASGGTAVVLDIRETMDRDFVRAVGFVLLGIFIVLLLMLRSLVAPLYLIATVVLSFTCTLGLTHLVFSTVWDIEGLTWYVPFFMFVFLVALGMDYSIFLFGRIKEEVGNHGIREGIHIAVARTGAIITSAGIILSGTFAAMMSGEIKGLAELGFAVAVGVLIDTFVVRTILDPALATLFDKWTWWPGGVPQSMAVRKPLSEPGD